MEGNLGHWNTGLEVSNNDDEVESLVMVEKKTVVPTIPKVDVVRPKEQEKPVRKTVRDAEMYRSKGSGEQECKRRKEESKNIEQNQNDPRRMKCLGRILSAKKNKGNHEHFIQKTTAPGGGISKNLIIRVRKHNRNYELMELLKKSMKWACQEDQ
ncbi:hypothetical protein Tco_0272135 [Tanacetum coccineum]